MKHYLWPNPPSLHVNLYNHVQSDSGVYLVCPLRSYGIFWHKEYIDKTLPRVQPASWKEGPRKTDTEEVGVSGVVIDVDRFLSPFLYFLVHPSQKYSVLSFAGCNGVEVTSLGSVHRFGVTFFPTFYMKSKHGFLPLLFITTHRSLLELPSC